MKLVFIYGPPAAGKLSTAAALARLTGFKLFHNHLTVDCVGAVFDFGTPTFFRLVDQMRLDILEAAAREQVPGLIFTFVYASPEDDEFVSRAEAAVNRHGGEVCYVQLTCDPERLRERVALESRRQFGKLDNPEALEALLARYDLFSPVPDRDSLRLDNSDVAVEEAARMIRSHFELPVPS